MELLLFTLILIIVYQRPGIGLVLLLNIYLIRSIPSIDWDNPGYLADDALGRSLIMGVLLPMISMLFIFFKSIIYNKFKVFYRLDIYDFLIISLLLILVVYIPVSPTVYLSTEYFLKVLFLGASYYFISKYLLLNSNDSKIIIKDIFLTVYYFGIVISILAILILLFNKILLIRLTLPGIHPIPFSQSIGASFLVSLSIFISEGKLLNVLSKRIIKFNSLFLIYLGIALLMTNTRGVLLAACVCSFMLIIFNPYKVKKRKVFFYGVPIIIIFLYLVILIGPDFLFRRVFNSSNDESISNRMYAYLDSIKIFQNNPFGIGTGAFGSYSRLGYPHNLILQNIAEYGIIGFVWSLLLLIGMFYSMTIAFIIRKRVSYSIVIVVFFLYYFIESMFSFTLWMQKGLFLSFGLLSYIAYLKSKKS